MAIWRDPFLGGPPLSGLAHWREVDLGSRGESCSSGRYHRPPHGCVRVLGRQTPDESEVGDPSSRKVKRQAFMFAGHIMLHNFSIATSTVWMATL